MVTLAILGLYGAHLLGVGVAWGVPDEETMKNLSIMVVSYWVGSSHGSDRKTEITADQGGKP